MTHKKYIGMNSKIFIRKQFTTLLTLTCCFGVTVMLCGITYAYEMTIEAENADAIKAPMVVANDPDASGGQFIWMEGPPRTEGRGEGWAEYKLHIPAPGTYTLWGKVIASDPQSDSFWVTWQPADPDEDAHKTQNTQFRWGVAIGSEWHWDRINHWLDGGTFEREWMFETAGETTLRIGVREDATMLDMIYITDNLSKNPAEVGLPDISVEHNVHLIYLRPRDRTSRPNIDTNLDALIQNVQRFFADQMQSHGFGRKTFTFETDANGKAVVHHIDGQFTDAYYRTQTISKVRAEITKQFNTSRHVYLVAIDISNEFIDSQTQNSVCGKADSKWLSKDNQMWWRDLGSVIVIPASGVCFNPNVAGHELGHAFGLEHDFRDTAYLMAYGTQQRLSHCAAEWLSVHPFLNTHPTNFNQNTTIEMQSQRGARFQFQITDTDGLHQAQLLLPTTGGDPAPGIKLHGCQTLNGESSSTATFVANEVLGTPSQKVTLHVIDTYGNITKESFLIQTDGVVQKDNNSVTSTVSISPSFVQSPATGEHLTFTLYISNGIAVAGYQATVQFDTDALRYIGSENGNYLPEDAFFSPLTTNGNTIQLAATMFSGSHDGDGTLATLTFEVIAIKPSTLTLSEVILSDSDSQLLYPDVVNAEIVVSDWMLGDVNGDGVVNIQDLVRIAASFGQTGHTVADATGDGVVNIADLVKVASIIGTEASAPSAIPQILDILTPTEVEYWLTLAQHTDLIDPIAQRGILVLEQLLAVLIPKHTALLPNYPNPFNPETWIPYQLAEPAEVLLTIYAVNGMLIRTLALGHQPIGIYQDKKRAMYWNGENEIGESVASGVYFYTLTAGDFTATRKMLIIK